MHARERIVCPNRFMELLMPHTLSFAEFLDSLRESFALLWARPFKWLLITVVFLIAVESLMFIPYVGFVVKLAVAGLLIPQWLLMFADVNAGQTPKMRRLLGGFTRSPGQIWVLIAAVLFPFLAGALYLIIAGGWQGAEYFFGHMSKASAPSPERFYVFKLVMGAVSPGFAFVAAAVALRHRSGRDALADNFSAAIRNWPVLVFLFTVNAAFDALEVSLPSAMPMVAAVILSIVLLIVFVAWIASFTYAISVRALGIAPRDTASAGTTYRPVDA